MSKIRLTNYLKPLMWCFAAGAGMRLIHAWSTYFESGQIWPAGGISDYIQLANSQQIMINIHVSFCTLWALILFYQFYNKLSSSSNITSSTSSSSSSSLSNHAKWGYFGAFIATIASITGWSSVWTLQIPSYVGICIKTQLLIGAPAFYWEVISGIVSITKYKNYKRHQKHMILALIGTFADAGNGFSIYISRKLFEGTPHQQWAQDVGVLSLNIISIIPFIMPGIGPHTDHILNKMNWRLLKENFIKNCTIWDIQALSTIIGGIILGSIHIIGLLYLYSINPWKQEYVIK
eukprot:399372_1